MNLEQLAALFAIGVPVLSFVGSWVGGRVHLHYMRRDLEETRRSVRAAHWRLDEINAPPAPTVSR